MPTTDDRDDPRPTHGDQAAEDAVSPALAIVLQVLADGGAGRVLVATYEEVDEPTVDYDPAVHDSAAWKRVRCSRCGRRYVCAPGDDFMTPAPDLGWDRGGVCESCLLTLARRNPR